MKIFYQLIFVLLLSILLISNTIYSQDLELSKTFVVAGRSILATGDVSATEQNALQDAMQNAIEQALITLIPAETYVEKFELIYERIIDKPQIYVGDYEILKRYEYNNAYIVLARATVSLQQLKEDLSSLGFHSLSDAKAIQKPHIMIVIPEQHISRHIPDPAGETEMVRKFLEKGFNVVDQTQSAKIRESDQVKALLRGDEKAAKAIGKQYGAEVIIVGEAFSELSEPAHGLINCRARVEARAIESDTAKILTANAKTAGGTDTVESVAGKKALQRAGGLLADYFIDQLMAKWSEKIASGEVRLVISGIKFDQLVKFEKALKTNISDIEAIHRRSYEAGIATIDIQTKVDAQRIAEELTTKTHEGIKFEITAFTANRIDLKLISK